MKKILLFLLIFSFSKLFAQCPPGGGTPHLYTLHPIGEIADGPSRIEIYRTKKNPIISSTSKHKYTDSIGYSACGFLEVLNMVASNLKHTGLRIYIGMNQKNEFVLFFAPTEGLGNETDKDVPDQYYKIVRDHASKVSVREFYDSTKNYENFYWNELTQNGKEYRRIESLPDIDKFEETRALWYNREQVTSPEDIYHVTGLKDYLEKLLIKKVVDSIRVYFGAFQSPSKYDYQIDLVFSIFKKGDGVSFFGAGENLKLTEERLTKIKLENIIKSRKTRAYNIFRFTDPTFNTGIPCPPYKPGCTACSCN